MNGERGDAPSTNPSDDDDRRPSGVDGNRAERQSASNEDQQRRAQEREADEASQRGQRDVRGDEERARGENLGQNDEDLDVSPKILEQLSNEVIRRLSDEELDRAIKTGKYDTPEFQNLRRLQESVRRASQENEEAQIRVAEYNEQLAVRQTLGLVDVFYKSYNLGINHALRRGLTFEHALEEGKYAVRELVERQLSAIEEDDTGVRSEDVGALQQAINITIVDDLFRAELTRKAVARSYLHYGAFTSKYIGGEEWAKVPTNFVGMHVREILETPGVKEAIDLLEGKDQYGTAGEYYRNSEAMLDENDPFVKAIVDYETKKAKKPLTEDQLGSLRKSVWLVNKRFELIKSERSNQTKPKDKKLRNIEDFSNSADDLILKLGIYEMSQTNPDLDKQNTPKLAVNEIVKNFTDVARQANIIDAQGQETSRQQDLIKLLYDANRAFELGIRLHHMTGVSAMFDGPRWKEGAIIPEGYAGAGERAGKNRSVELNPILEWYDPKDGWKGDPNDPRRPKIKLNLRTAAEESKKADDLSASEAERERAKVIKRTLEDVRGDDERGQRYRFSSAWTLAYQKFYRENWDKIDFIHSARSGRAARMANRLLNFPIILEHPSEVHPGRAEYLRKFTYLGIPSLIQMSAYSGAQELVENWNSQFRIMKEGWIGRLANGEKLKSQINRKEPDMLNSHEALREFVKSLKTMKPTMKEYMTPAEVGASVENWLRGLLEFRARYSNQADLLNMTEEGLEDEIYHAQVEGLIGVKKTENIKRDMFSPMWIRRLSKIKLFNHEHFPGKVIWAVTEFWESLKKTIKGLWIDKGFLSFIWELIKQISTPPK